MASVAARGARLLARLGTKLPMMRAVGRPDAVLRYRRVLASMQRTFGRYPRGVTATQVDAGGVRAEWVAPQGATGDAPAILYLHGGGYVACSPAHYRSLTGALARACGARVLVPDYRLAPENPFPAALEDAVAAYGWLLARGIPPARIAIGGDSAGGGLTLSALLALRERGLPLPAGAFLLSPWTDLASTGESMTANAASEDVIVVDGSHRWARFYLGDLALDDPRASGLYADLQGLPPLLVHASTIEVLRDDAVRLAAKAESAGVDARIRLWDGVHHVWQLFAGLPESRQSIADIRAFCERVWRSPSS